MCVCVCVRNNIVAILHIIILFLFLSFAKSSSGDNNVVVVVVTERVVAFKIIRFKRNFNDVFHSTRHHAYSTVVHDTKILYYYDVIILLFCFSFRMRADVTYAYLHTAVAAIDTYTTYDVRKYCNNIIVLRSRNPFVSGRCSTRRKHNATFIMRMIIIWHIKPACVLNTVKRNRLDYIIVHII